MGSFRSHFGTTDDVGAGPQPQPKADPTAVDGNTSVMGLESQDPSQRTVVCVNQYDR